MQANVEEKLVPEFYSDAELTRDFDSHLKLDEKLQDDDVRLSDDDDVSDEEEDFSFDCGELSTSPITAEDAFDNGQIKPAIPRLDRDLLHENLPAKPPVQKIFVETNNGREMTSSGSGGDDIVGPYCEWSSRKVVEASPGDEACKKSNSTGFSKIWRFRERVDRSNSDGRDTYVYLNNSGHAAAPAPKAAKVKRKVKKSSKTAPLSAHEVYLKSKAQGDERRRSYLPYRPDLVGFFTNVNSGLTKNVHPF